MTGRKLRAAEENDSTGIFPYPSFGLHRSGHIPARRKDRSLPLHLHGHCADCDWSDAESLGRTLFNKNKTPVKPHLKPRLITSGIFRFTRNPMYLGMTLILFGVSICVGSLTTFVSPVVFFLISEGRFVPPKEAVMENLFGEEYLEYKRRVERWV
jgi:hypothetical protein